MPYYTELFALFLTASRRPHIAMEKNTFFVAYLTTLFFYLLLKNHLALAVSGVKFYFKKVLSPTS